MTATTPDLSTLLACHECDLLHSESLVGPGSKAQCARCGATLYRGRENPVDRSIAFALAALVFFVIANTYPFISFSLEGRVQHSTLWTGVVTLFGDGLWSLAGLVLLASVAVPFLKITALLYVMLPIRLRRPAPHLARTFRLLDAMHPWGMLEVYLLGVLVAFVKLSQMATIVFGPGFYGFLALMVASIAASNALDSRAVWRQIEELQQ